MRWSVSVEAEGDRVLTHEEIVELADAVAASSGIAVRHRHHHATAPSWSSRRRRPDEAVELARGRVRPRPRRRAGLPPWPVAARPSSERRGRRRLRRGARMIRLGSLAGYPFEGPRVLAGWTPPAVPAVYAIVYKPEPDDQARARTPSSTSTTPTTCPPSASRSSHPRASCWVRRAGNRWKLYICTYEVPGGLRSHREQIAQELTADLPPELQHRAVRPGVEGRVDRRVHRADHRPAHHRPRPGDAAARADAASRRSSIRRLDAGGERAGQRRSGR